MKLIHCMVLASACMAWDAPAADDPPIAPAARELSPLRHIVVIFQENRTPDNLFHGLKGADIADYGFNSKGEKIELKPVALDAPYGLSHGHHDFLMQYDKGRLDGADKISVDCRTKVGCPPANPQFKYVKPSDVAPYFDMAQSYTFADRMFQSNQGGSFPAHQYIIAGTSTPGGVDAAIWAAGNPKPVPHPTGCVDAPPNQHVPTIDQAGYEDFQGIYPCFEHQTVMDLLESAGLTWAYYAPRVDGMWTAPAAIDHIRRGPHWGNVKSPQTLVLKDIAAGRLANVTWVIPTNDQSDHAGSNDGTGPSWVASIVNAIGNSAFWQDTAILITWDDWGGWYDHVAPPMYSAYEDSFRVPLIVVSPYAKKGYVSHVTHDFGSVVRFMESTFDLPTLGYEDSRADDLADCFDFQTKPSRFKTIPAPLPAQYFIKYGDTHAGEDPDDE